MKSEEFCIVHAMFLILKNQKLSSYIIFYEKNQERTNIFMENIKLINSRRLQCYFINCRTRILYFILRIHI